MVLAEQAFFVDLFQRCRFVFVDCKNLVKFHQVEDLFDVVVDVAHSQVNFGRLALFSEQHELSNHGRRHEADLLKVQNDLLIVRIVDQLGHLKTKTCDS